MAPKQFHCKYFRVVHVMFGHALRVTLMMPRKCHKKGLKVTKRKMMSSADFKLQGCTPRGMVGTVVGMEIVGPDDGRMVAVGCKEGELVVVVSSAQHNISCPT